MTSSIKLFAPHKITLSFLVLLLAHQLSHGQAFTGTNVVEPNSTHTYYFDDGAYYYPNEWLINGGTLTGSGQNGTQYHVNIKWGEVPGYAMVTFKSGMMLLGGMSVTINSTVPDAPPAPTVANHPGYTRLTRGNPPNGEVWYWQDGPSGTSTLNSSSYVDRTFGTEYYIKSYRSSVDQWSSVTMVNYTVSPIAAPPMPIITNYPGYTRLTRGNPPAGEIWYWQDTPSGMDTLDSSAHVDRSLGTKYYLRSHVAAIDQWGPTTTIDYSVDPQFQGLSDENYIHTIVPRTGTTDVSTLADNEKMESVTYFDGLGRPMQSVGIRAGAGQEDIITHVGYDNYGRQSKEYLPYSSQTSIGSFRTAALSATNSYYDAARYETDFPGMTIADINPYSEKEFESSPLNRVLKQAAPGHDWQLGGGHEIEFEYTANTFDPNSPTDPANDNVRLYRVEQAYADKTYTPSLSLDPGALGYYGQGELYKTVTRDENWTNGKAHTSEEFTDKQGRVVLKRTYGDSKVGSVIMPNAPHDTYYVYDDYGNLTYVLPPKMEASTAPLTTVNAQLDELGYQYTYDYRNRLVEKKIPGKGREYIVYNKLDQPILTQDANLRAQDKWLFTKYDAFGRVAYTGEMTRGIGRAALQDDADLRNPQFVTKRTSDTTMVGATIYYNNESYPVNYITEILTINYYDNYTFDGFVAMPATHDGQNILNHDNSPGTQKWTKGLATGSKVRVLDQVPAKWITTYTGYDTKGRPIYVKSVNDYLVTTDVVISTLDFTGAVEKTKSWHTKDNATIETEDTFTYDHMGRLKKQTQELVGMNPTEVIFENTYDDLGQLTNKGVGGKTTQGRLQNVSFAYNIRGWLKQINDVENLGNNLFGFKMNYNHDAEGTASAPALYNGNISQTIWRSANDNTKRASAYKYDALNRITHGHFREADANGVLNQKAGRYDLHGVVYDKNGNIETLKRNGHTAVDAAGIVTDYGMMDDLTYDYQPNSNKLMKVTDAALNTSGISEFNDLNKVDNDYAYDANGNMVKDLNKEIGTAGVNGITYNYLNLPTEVKFRNTDTRKINYIYDATGNKLEKKVTEGSEITRTYYAGNHIYTKVNSRPDALKFFNHPEGYVNPVYGGSGKYQSIIGFDYVYQYNDHLGNIRLSYSDVNNDYKTLANYTFDDEIGDWTNNGGPLTIDSGRLKVIVNGQYTGPSLYLGGDFVVGQQVKISIAVDTGNTDIVRKYLYETDANGVTLNYYVVDYDIQTGDYSFEHTIVAGTKLFLKFDKSELSGDVGADTYFFIDNIFASTGVLEIVEENNYYPFGLRHKGYNNNVSANSNSVASKFKYNGIELEESLGLNLYEMSFRQYDPAIGRFNSIDPVTHYSMSTYTAFDNNPVFWADPSGANAVYNWDDGKYYDNGQEVTFEQALGSYGLNSDGSEKSDESNNSNEISLPEIGNIELAKNKSNRELGCQQGDCYDPIDFKNDSAEVIYNKLLNNVTTFVKAKNEAIRTGDQMIAVYIEELIRLDNIYGAIDKSSGNIINRTVKYNGGTIEIVALPVTNDKIVGYHFKGARKRMSGSNLYYSYEVHLLGGYRNKVAGNDHTGFKPIMLNLRFSSIEQYNSFVKEVDKASKQ